MLVFTTRLKNFLKTGKINTYEQVKGLFLDRDSRDGDLQKALENLTKEEQEQILDECWSILAPNQKKMIVNSLYHDKWDPLILDYVQLPELEKIKRLELLSYISCQEVVSFLLAEMKSKREGIRLTACAALKRQDPLLVFEPMLEALLQPEEWLPSRVFEILKSLGPGLDSKLLEIIENVDEKVQEVIVQIIGEIGDKSCVSNFEKIFPTAGGQLRLRMAEALEKLKCKESWPLLVKLLEEDRWQTRMLAAKTLGQIGEEKAIPLLKTKIKFEEDPLVRECISDALATLEEGPILMVSNWVREG